MTLSPVVFLVDVDNTLLDNDGIQDDLRLHLERSFGVRCRDRYWTILEELFATLGYRDYLGAMQRYRVEHPHDLDLLSMSSFLIDYPFAGRLFPQALDVLRRLRGWGPTVVVSDGDVIFQPRKVQRSGIWDEVENVLIYIHKEQELEDIARRYPARHYVFVDDKLRILTVVKRVWGDRVTTVLPRQGRYANDPHVLAENPPADLAIDRIGTLLEHDLARLLPRSASPRIPGHFSGEFLRR